VFQDLDDTQIAAVGACFTKVSYQRGEKIFDISEEPDALWAVIEGEVSLHHEMPGTAPLKEMTITTISRHMIFGISSLVKPHRYILSAYCATRQCRLLKAKKDCLIPLFERDPKIGYLVMKRLAGVVGRRFHQVQEEFVKRRGQDLMNHW
jgi:CRP-like cAMP-binding protein